jgi:hypothetical protein
MGEMAMSSETEQRPATENDGWEWMLIEIMGHRRHWGRTRQEERFGAKMIRVDIPVKGDPAVHGWTTHYYGGASIFSLTMTDEATVMEQNKPYEPTSRLRLPPPIVDVDADEDLDLE